MNSKESDNSMVNQNAIIYWQPHIGETYMYGSIINYVTKDHVTFQNDLFSAGSFVHTWLSSSSYQVQRSVVALPLLENGIEYQIKMNASVMPENTVYLQFKFYDRYEDMIDSVTIKNGVGKFIYPNNAYAYSMALINAGLQELVFHHVEISEAIHEKQLLFDNDGLYISDILNNETNSSLLQVLFTEPVVGTIGIVPDNLLNQIPDVVQITSSKLYGGFYMNNQVENDIIAVLDQIQKIYEVQSINFIGYGPLSSAAALYYATKVTQSTAYVSSDYGDISLSKNVIYTDGYEQFIVAKKNFVNTPKHTYYQVEPLIANLKIVGTLLDKSSRLQSYIDFVGH